MKNENQYGGIKQVLAVSIGLFLVFVDSTVVNIALPTIIDEYSITLDLASWVINAFVITLAVLLVTFGKLADIFGRFKIFLLGLIIFTISSFLCGIAPNVEMLIISRCLQGMGGAMVIPTSMMLVRTAVPPEKLGMAMGIWGAVGALAVAIGPTLGGVLTEFIDWRWIFYINIPIVVGLFPFILLAFRGHKDSKSPFRLDILGVITLSISLYLLTYAILQGEQLGWTSKAIYLYFGSSIIMSILFIFIQKKVKHPLVDLTIFKNRYYIAGVLANLLGGLLLMGTLVLIPLYLIQVKGYDTLESSLLITPMSAVMLVVAPLIGKIIDRIGYFFPMTIGYLFTLAGCILLFNLDVETELGHLIFIMSILGTGLGILMVTSVAVSTASVSDQHISLGSSIFATSRNIGGAVGVALFVSLTLSFLNANSTDIIEDGLTNIEELNIPPKIKEQIVSEFYNQENNYFEGKNQLNTFNISEEMKNQVIAKEKQEILQTLPEGTTTLPLETEEKIVTNVETEFTLMEEKVSRIQNDVVNNIQTELVNAMTKAFLAGIGLTALFSTSLILLRRKKMNSIVKQTIPKKI